jgi:cell wall-associated NlpC family hydrolase
MDAGTRRPLVREARLSLVPLPLSLSGMGDLPKSPQRIQFETLARGGQWEPAVNLLSSLAMPEMLPALKVFDAATRSLLTDAARRFLSPGAAVRIQWAAEGVELNRVPEWTPAGLPGDQVTDARTFFLAPPAAPSGNASANRRARVVEVALSQVGAHYLWGAAGATPGRLDGMPGRPGSVMRLPDVLDPGSPVLRSAACDVDGYHVCAGRFSRAGGRVVAPRDKELDEYLLGLNRLQPAAWQPWNGLWPRKMKGRTVTEQIVLGEDCTARKHFDCIGFVNWCLSLAVDGRGVQLGITQFKIPENEKTPHICSPVRLAEARAADIVTRGIDHIGFLDGGGRVVHASQSSDGVIVEAWIPSAWDSPVRYPL